MAFTRKFYTADTHFSHEGMLTFGGRPFTSVAEMDRTLIDLWNSTVGKDDIVYHLGDFAFGLGDAGRVQSIYKQLNGRKYLVIGNHGVRSDGELHPTLAALDWAAAPTHYMEARDEGERVILAHYAQRVWNASHHGSFHFFGHSHGKLEAYGRSRDVGVDMPDCGFAPRTFKQLTAGMSLEIAA
jgi:calcineurin-like phosphoesterase family protein